MKKFLLFVACTALLICAFAIVSNAEATETTETVTFENLGAPIDGMGQMHIFGDEDHGTAIHRDGWYASEKTDENGKPLPNNTDFARVELVYKDSQGNDVVVTYPTYYILENNSTLTFNFTKLSNHLGTTLGVTNIRKIEIPYGTTVIPAGCFAAHFDPTKSDDHPFGHVDQDNTTLQYVYLENTVLEIGDFALNLTKVGSETLGDHVGESGPTMGNHNHQMLQSIGYRAFHYCSLTEFNFNKHLVHLGEGAFRGNKFEHINLSKCVELKKIPAHCFHEAKGTIKSIIMSVSIEEIGDYAFTGSNANIVFLGLHLRKVGHQALTMKKLDIFIIPVSIQEMFSDSFEFGDKSYTPTFVPAKLLSDAEALVDLMIRMGYDDLKQNNNIEKLFDDSVSYWARSTFCRDYLGGHIADPYSGITRLEYPNGISHEGVAYGGACAVCGQTTQNGEFEVRPILISKGYSICTFSKNGKSVDAFANGYEIYHNALHIYEQVYGDVEIGILFLLDQKYDSTKDLRSNISKTGVCLTQDQLPSTNLDNYTSIDYIFTYSTGISYVAPGTDIPRGKMPIIISAYLLHLDETKAKHDIVVDDEKVTENLYGTSYYVQDLDEICIHGWSRNDSKYATVSYESIFGMIKSLGLN